MTDSAVMFQYLLISYIFRIMKLPSPHQSAWNRFSSEQNWSCKGLSCLIFKGCITYVFLPLLDFILCQTSHILHLPRKGITVPLCPSQRISQSTAYQIWCKKLGLTAVLLSMYSQNFQVSDTRLLVAGYTAQTCSKCSSSVCIQGTQKHSCSWKKIL